MGVREVDVTAAVSTHGLSHVLDRILTFTADPAFTSPSPHSPPSTVYAAPCIRNVRAVMTYIYNRVLRG